MNEIFTKDYPLTASDIDCHGLCRLSALLSYIQNVATDHATLLELHGEKMVEQYGAIWMMARMYLSLSRPIVSGDNLSLGTWHRGVDKTPITHRDIDIVVDGERIGEAVIAWIVVDLRERRLVKPASLPTVVASPRPRIVKDIIPAKLKPPEDLQQALTRTVRYSDTDINGHMNNTKYADIACDAIQYNKRAGWFVSEFQANYIHECFPGDNIVVLHGEQDGLHYIRGTDSGNKARFDISLRLDSI